MTFDKSVVFSGTLVSSTNITDRHKITEILLKVVLNTMNKPTKLIMPYIWDNNMRPRAYDWDVI